jgi:hypothetical protein
MRFSTIFAYLALAVGLAIAGPLADRDTNPILTDAGNSTQPNPEHPVERSHAGRGEGEAKVAIVGERGATSKREDYNALDKRGPTFLILCGVVNCSAGCTSINIDSHQLNVCYWTSQYRSLYLVNLPPTSYHVYVGYHVYRYPRDRCISTFFARSSTYLFGIL